MRAYSTLIVLLICFSLQFHAQESEIDRLIQSELKMTFPSIHFKHQSADYAPMPYSVDSCFKYIASNFDENINSLVIWRDTLETEMLTAKRIKKLKTVLKKYLKTKEFEIYSMENEQKVSRHTIKMTIDSSKINYLLTLNSVFDISKTQRPFSKKLSHLYRPKLFCWACFKSFYHLDKKSRNLRKAARLAKEKAEKKATQ